MSTLTPSRRRLVHARRFLLASRRPTCARQRLSQALHEIDDFDLNSRSPGSPIGLCVDEVILVARHDCRTRISVAVEQLYDIARNWGIRATAKPQDCGQQSLALSRPVEVRPESKLG